ncbi:hypothetical protein GJ654_20335 [Rhodoblastus acidophilus]|uniref:Uncharacterized protein n=1 Tax=Rhodoblastus acidophilus TaxID=1074 RepID=A0A6N8DSQ6_RHOAC|nr:hypothetical protein [Rhodoblastus acidophilus]MCW2276535.1 hypothetical protein [Rhodoblastus acidophilus]MTV33328.1 hypothetical protein [Rhodoblastus acidophilus]
MDDAELLTALDGLRATMVSVATGGADIKVVNASFHERYENVAAALAVRGIENTLPFSDLWEWYGHWRADGLTTYQSRRNYVSGVFKPIAARVRSAPGTAFEPTGWERVDRTVAKARIRLAAATGEEDYQGIGLLGREALISLADVVWKADRHPSLDGVAPSPTDAKRRLEAYIAVELATNANEQARKHARAALDLAVGLQHKRSATWRDAAMCLEATASVANLVAIIEGRRDPS